MEPPESGYALIQSHCDLSSRLISPSSSPATPFPKTLVINLKRRADRWESFEDRAQKAGLPPLQRWDACDGNALRPSPLLDELYDGWDFDQYRAVIACAISHSSLWQYIAHQPEDAVLVLEDDVLFNPDFMESWATQWEQWRQDSSWSVAYLGGSWDNRLSWEESVQKNTLVACSYLLRRRGAMQLLAHVKYKGFQTAADCFVSEVLRARDAAVFATAPLTTHPGYRDSDIQFPAGSSTPA